MSHRDRGARRGARLRPGAAGAVRRGGRRGSRSSSTPACGSSRRCARCARSCALWDEITRDRYGVDRRQAAAVPLRRAGQLARPDRGAAGEQRAAHRARDARRHAVQGRPGPGRAAAGLERGARPAPAVGPAVVAADAAGAGLRVRPARVRRPLRRLARGRGQGRPSSSTGGPRRDGPGRRRWAARSPRSRAATSSRALVASHAARRAADRVRRGRGRRGQPRSPRPSPTR